MTLQKETVGYGINNTIMSEASTDHEDGFQEETASEDGLGETSYIYKMEKVPVAGGMRTHIHHL